MRKATPCAKCGSDTIINAPLMGGSGEGTGEVYIQVLEHPDALMFKGPRRGALQARVCGKCGYTELYTANAPLLYSILHKAKMQRERAEAKRMQQPSATLLRPAAASPDNTEPEQLLRPANETPDEKE